MPMARDRRLWFKPKQETDAPDAYCKLKYPEIYQKISDVFDG